MPDDLEKRGRELEEAFFNKQNDELVAKLRAEEAAKRKKSDLAASTGIQDPLVLQELLDVGVEPGTLAALSLAPLVLMAWRKGKIETHERGAILRAAEQRGLKPGTTVYQLVEKWLEQRPSPGLRPAWGGDVESPRTRLPQEAYAALRDDIVKRTREVARAAGGILRVATVFQGEKQLLAEIQAALR